MGRGHGIEEANSPEHQSSCCSNVLRSEACGMENRTWLPVVELEHDSPEHPDDEEGGHLGHYVGRCVFCADDIPCLGDFVGHNGVRMDPDKVQTIKDWPVPRTQEDLHSFLGLTGYVQCFCPEYASPAATMFALLKKKHKRNAKIHLSDEQLKNFRELKRSLCNPPVLHLPDFSQPMHLRTDASKFAVGGVLVEVVDGVERPIAYTSRKMKAADLNYPTQQQEL
ncbi:unnamed protein product [Phytophthora fragariaefolia]|uniref:Unnamed protein product n=1 Tax=Phytophthora fragariaefolia TaxID=1490495 RepID=A0A9W7D2H4_9STRA|nr:unnamed protein product [Phytophthora fragariaefolia]